MDGLVVVGLGFCAEVAPGREDEADDASGREMVRHVLNPSEVGVAGRRDAVLAALVVAEALAAPVGGV